MVTSYDDDYFEIVTNPRNTITKRFFETETKNFNPDLKRIISEPLIKYERGLSTESLIYICKTPDDEIDPEKYYKIIKRKCKFERIPVPDYIPRPSKQPDNKK